MGLCAGLALCLAALPAQAAVVTYDLNYVFSPTPGSVTPLATVTLTDVANDIKFDVVNLAGANTKLESLYFNFSRGSLNPSQLTFSNVSAATGTYSTLLAATTTDTSNTMLKADGDGYFDGKIAYTTSNFLANGATLSFRLGLTGQNLDVTDFNFLSLSGPGTNPGTGSFTLAAQILNMPGGGSVWVGTPTPAAPVPLPAAALFFGSGLLGLAGALRKKLNLA